VRVQVDSGHMGRICSHSPNRATLPWALNRPVLPVET